MKHLVAIVAGSGLAITGAILLSGLLAQLDWARVEQYGFFHELKAMTPIVLVSGTACVLGVLTILGSLINIVFHNGMEEETAKNKK